MNTTLTLPRHQLDGYPDINHQTRTGQQPIFQQLPNNQDSGIQLLATALTLITSTDPHEIIQRLDRLPYAWSSYHPPRTVDNFSQPSDGVRSHFKVLAHTTGDGGCAKTIRNVVRRLCRGVKLSTVKLHLCF